MQKQMTLPGHDTELSLAADEYLEAVEKLDDAKSKKEERQLNLIELMRGIKKTSITHNGHLLELRRGKITKDTIVVK